MTEKYRKSSLRNEVDGASVSAPNFVLKVKDNRTLHSFKVLFWLNMVKNAIFSMINSKNQKLHIHETLHQIYIQVIFQYENYRTFLIF